LFYRLINIFSQWAIPIFILFIMTYGYIKKIKIYEVFVEGAKMGFFTSVRIIPYLMAVMVSVGIFRASGAMDFFISLLAPLTRITGIPAEVLPMAIIRPLSGGGAQGIMVEIFKTYGPDSCLGRIAATMNGATDTTLYILAVYFGSVGIKNTRHALPAGLIADLAGFIASVIAVKLLLM